MSYKDILRKQIRELEEKISQTTTEKQVLIDQLNKLRLTEFEESERENNSRQLLKG